MISTFTLEQLLGSLNSYTSLLGDVLLAFLEFLLLKGDDFFEEGLNGFKNISILPSQTSTQSVRLGEYNLGDF